MNWLMIKNDFKRNKAINLALLLFMVFSTTLSVSSVLMAVQTFTSISAMYGKAAPPHFLQMHKGEINEEEIDKFMTDNKQVTYSQTVVMINVFGENITVINEADTYNLSDIRLDIGLVKQNEERDLLLNSNHDKVILNDGEIGIPVILKGMYDMEIGDKLILSDIEELELKNTIISDPSVGLFFGIMNMLTWFVFNPNSWWMGVLHLPLVIISLLGLKN